MNARKPMVLLVAVLALVAAGCGGGSDEASGDTDTVVTETTTDEVTTSEDTETDATTDDFDASELGGKCAELAGIGAQMSEALSGQDSNIEDVAATLDELADKVPDEIKADYRVLADYVQKMAEALKGVDLSSGATPSAEVLAKLQQLATSADSQKLEAAAAHVEAWAKDNC